MIDEWRYSHETMEERRICLSALLRNGVTVDRSCYRFCHEFTSSGASKALLEKYQPSGDMEGLFTAIYAAYQSQVKSTQTLSPLTTDQMLDTYGNS